MAPSSVAPPPEHEVPEHPVEEQIDRAQPPRDLRPPRESGRAEHVLLADSLLDLSTTRPGQRSLDFVLSMIIHAIFLGILILLPLYFTEAIDLRQFTQTFLVAPPPPPPPPPPPSPGIVKMGPGPRRVFTQAGKLLAPGIIPQHIAMLKEEELPPEVGGAGVVGGVPGGVPGGQMGGVIGGIISGAQRTYVPVAPVAAQPKAPIRVGGRVKPPRAISTPDPVYPTLAKQARIQGDVLIDAVIDTHGNVVEMQVVSGHPLLIQAAMEALRKWKYEPTYLNEEPVSVQLIVTVRFRLG